MALKLTLKPHERLIIGGAAVTNGNSKCELLIENNVPILRQKNILRQEDANTPCSRIYFVIQLMYVDQQNLSEHHKAYWQLVRDVVRAAPSTLGLIDQISQNILVNKFYEALKLAKKLVAYEQEVMNYARKSGGSIGGVSENSCGNDVGP
jgi:flagellar biosynthesis repressor protein FlbT